MVPLLVALVGSIPLQDPSPNLLYLLLPIPFLGFFRIYRIRVSLEIHLTHLDKSRTLQNLPSNKHDQHDRQLNVKTHKIHTTEFWAEATPALH